MPVSATDNRGSPPSAGCARPAGRIVSGRRTAVPTAAERASATRTPRVGTRRERRAYHSPAYPPATTATPATNATQVSWACHGSPVGKGWSQRRMPSPYPMPSWPAPASSPAPAPTPSVFAQVRTAMAVSLRVARPGRDPPPGQPGQYLRREQRHMIEIAQVEPQIHHLGADRGELADPVDHLRRGTAQRVLRRQRARHPVPPGPVLDLGRGPSTVD